MMNFVYSKDNFLLKKQIQKMIQNYQKENFEIESFSFVDDSFLHIFQALQSFPLFSSKKIIILNDCWFVSDAKVSLHKTFNLTNLMNLLKKGTPEHLEIIFTLNSDKFSKKNKTAIWFQNHCELKLVPLLNQQTLEKFIQENFKKEKQKISQEAISFLINHLPNELQIIDGEIKKLTQLHQDIELIDVQQNLAQYFEQDIFEMSNYFLNNDLNNFLKQYQNYRLTNNDNLPLITLLTNNLAILRNALILQNQDLTLDLIAQRLEVNLYRLKLLLKANKNTINELNDRIIMLYNLNKNLVRGRIDQHIIPEYEFIKILSNIGGKNATKQSLWKFGSPSK